jgi:uncharacterized HAD superfamily protein
VKKFKVGFDIDDVFLHTYQAMHVIAGKAGITNGVTPTSWNPYDEYGCSREEWTAVMDEAARMGWLYKDVIPDQDALRAVRELAWDGHEIHLVTARGFMGEKDIVEEHTEGWLVEYAVPHKSLTYSRTKGEVTARLRLDYFLDDNVQNWLDVAGSGPTRSHLLDRPWNQDINAGIFRVKTVQEYVDIIKEAASE